jgi:hypothetical protein
MKRPVILALLALSGCVTTAEMATKPQFRVYNSGKPRGGVADCLLNRVTSPDLHPQRSDGPNATTVSFTSAGALLKPPPTVYLFTIRDAAHGSATEVRRLGHSDLTAAETCF